MKKLCIPLSIFAMTMPVAAFAQTNLTETVQTPEMATATETVTVEQTEPVRRAFDPIAFNVGDWKFKFSGFMQTAFDVYGIDTIDDMDVESPHTGFAHLNARLNFDISYAKNLSMRMSLDGSGGVDIDGDTEQTIGLKDIYIDYKAASGFRMRLGQFKPPLDLENMTSETDANFTRRSIVSGGGSSDFNNKATVAGTTLNSGFSPSRELGLSLYSDFVGNDSVGFKYNVAVTNGNKATELLNDDDMFAVYGRIELGLHNALIGSDKKGQFFTIATGFVYEMNDFTPDVHEDDDDDDNFGHTVTAYAELRTEVAGFAFDFEYLWRSKDIIASERNLTVVTNGLLAQVAYTIPVEYWRLQFAYRFAGLFIDNHENNSPFITGWLGDLVQHTVALAYHVENYPIVIRAEYTHMVEFEISNYLDDDDGIGNDLFGLMVQVKW